MGFSNHHVQAGTKPETGVVLPAPAAPSRCSPERRHVLAGLLVRKESWHLSLRGYFLLLLALTGLLFTAHRCVYPWMAVTRRVPGNYLVVEGWIHNSGFQQAIDEFDKGGYCKVLTTGCAIQDTYDFDGKATYADWGAARLEKLGMSKELVQSVPCWVDRKDRTYNSALTVKNWFHDNHIPVAGINVITLGPHARRTRLLFQEAFGNKVAVGVIATEDDSYDARHWWRTSEGVREVVGETIAYVYAKFLFWPPKATNEDGR